MEGYAFTTTYRVRAADLDYRGMVSNSAVLNMFQEGRIAYFAALGPYRELDIGNGCGIIQREADIHFLEEMSHGEIVEIGVRVKEIQNAYFLMSYRIEKEGAALAEGKTLLVAYDYKTKKPRRLPTPFKQAIEKLEGEKG